MFNLSTVTTPTMTSLELVDYINLERKAEAEAKGLVFPSKSVKDSKTNEVIIKGAAKLDHADFMAKVPQVLGILAPKFLGTSFYINGAGNKVPQNIYTFPKREACLMAMSYSYELQAKVFDKMTALEAKAQETQKLPQNYHEALIALTSEVGKRIQLEAQALLDAPKVQFAEAVHKMEGACKIGDFCKAIGIGRNKLFAAMRNDGILMVNNMPYQNYLDQGLFVVIEQTPYTDSSGKAHPTFTTMVTGKGQLALQQKYAPQKAGVALFKVAKK